MRTTATKLLATARAQNDALEQRVRKPEAITHRGMCPLPIFNDGAEFGWPSFASFRRRPFDQTRDA